MLNLRLCAPLISIDQLYSQVHSCKLEMTDVTLLSLCYAKHEKLNFWFASKIHDIEVNASGRHVIKLQ